TTMPRFLAARQRPATSTVLPTSEPVPCSMMARAISASPGPCARDGGARRKRPPAPQIERQQRFLAGAHGMVYAGGMVDDLASLAPAIRPLTHAPFRTTGQRNVDF